MKSFFKLGVVVGALLMLSATLAPMMMVHAQFSLPEGKGGPVAIGQVAAEVDPSTGKVAIIQAPAVAPVSGGVIQLSAFGWLEPYVDSIVQALLGLGLAWLGKSKYSQWLDQSARDSLEAFAKNAASSLIADGFVEMQGKAVKVPSAAIANEVNTAADRIPDAMKRFGITPGGLAQKIVDAIPQTPAGAQIVASAHSTTYTVGNVSVSGNVDNIKAEEKA
jgi:hypothetical protein